MQNRLWKKVVAIATMVVLSIGVGAAAIFGLEKSRANAESGDYNAREVFDFNANWRFSKGEGIENSGSTAADARSAIYLPNKVTDLYGETPVWSTSFEEEKNGETWSTVSLPHTYNDTDTWDSYIETIGATGQSLNGERSMYGGTAWYRKTFTLPQSYSTNNKKVYIEFEAARQAAQVWINGYKLSGTYLNGFIAFGYDLTVASDGLNHLNYGDTPNVITVLVDNSYPYYISVATNDNNTPEDTSDDYDELVSMYDDGATATALGGDVIWNDGYTAYATTNNPIVWHDSHWHPNYGGLYRNSYLHVTNPLQLTLPLYSFLETEGTYVYTSMENGAAKTARINVDAQIANHTGDSQTFSLAVRVKDMTGSVVGSTTTTAQTFTAGKIDHVTAFVDLTNVIRWSTEYPYLYTVECAIIQDDTVIDNNSTQIGVRTFRATTDGGFYLNENRLKLDGWGQRTTNEIVGAGAAYPYWMTEYMIQQMKDAGAKYIRWGHSSAGADQIKACDKLGMVVTQPGVDGEGEYYDSTHVTNGTVLQYTATTYQIRADAFRDMVIYFRNSPSILFWELGNQLSYNSSGIMQNYIKKMRQVIDKYDYAGRGTDSDGDGLKVDDKALDNCGTKAATTNKDTSTRLSTGRGVGSLTNAYVEVAETTDFGNGYGSNPSLEGEYNRFEVRRGVWDKYTSGFTGYKSTATDGNSSYDNMTGESAALKQLEKYTIMEKKNGYILGGANWIYSDSLSHGRLLNEVARATGEVDGSLLEKETYYVSQVLFSDDIKTHIVGHWNYTNQASGWKKTVYVVSKADSVELTVTPTSGEAVTYTSYTQNISKYGSHLFIFNDVVYKSGTISAKGYDESDNEITGADDSITTSGSIASIKITRALSDENLLANGGDYLVLDIEAMDGPNGTGNRVVDFDGAVSSAYVNFTITGNSGDTPTCAWLGGYNSNIQNSNFKDYLYLEAGITRVILRTTMNAGQITVGASMTLGANTYTDSYEVSSVAISEAYSGCNYKAVTTTPYTLTGTEPTYGQNVGDSPIEEGEEPYTAQYITSLECNLGDSTFDILPIATNSKLYNDSDVTFSYVPRRYASGEYVVANNSLHDANSQIFGLSALHDCTAILMFPAGASIPTWVTTQGYTATNQVFKSSDNVLYKVFERTTTEDESLTLYSVDQYNNKSLMYIFGMCTPLLTNPESTNAYYNYDSLVEEPFNADSDLSGYNKATTSGTSISVEIDDNSLYLHDASSDAAWLCMPINSDASALAGTYQVTFDYKMMRSAKYARFSFQSNDGVIVNESSPFRLMFDSQSAANSSLSAYYQLGTASSAGTTSLTNLAEAWYSYKIVYNTSVSGTTGSVRIYTKAITAPDSDYVEIISGSKAISVNNSSGIKYFCISTGVSGSGDMYVKNLNIQKMTYVPAVTYNQVITGININGNPIDNFLTASTMYYMGEESESNPMPDEEDITVVPGNAYKSYSVISRDTYLKRIVIRTVDTADATTDYILSYAYFSEYSGYAQDKYVDRFMNISGIQADSQYSMSNLYSGNKVYSDSQLTFFSVPYEYSGAGVLQTTSVNKHGEYRFLARNDLTLIVMAHIDDAWRFNNRQDWVTTGKLVTASIKHVENEVTTYSGGIQYFVWTKNLAEGQTYSIDFSLFQDCTVPLLVAAKATDEIEREVLLEDDFSTINTTTGLPIDWIADSTNNATNPTYNSSATITHKYNDAIAPNEDIIVFEDTSNSVLMSNDEGVIGIADTPNDTTSSNKSSDIKKCAINKAFTEQTNKFTFGLDMYIYSTGNISINRVSESPQYIRIIFSNGPMSTTFDNSHKENYGIETYLHQENPTKKVNADGSWSWTADPDGLCLCSRDYTPLSGSNDAVNVKIIKNLPLDTWMDISYVVDTQRHAYFAQIRYYDNITEKYIVKTSPEQYFATNTKGGTDYLIDTVNNLGIGTGANASNHFAIKEVSISQQEEDVIQGISIDGTPVETFHQLTPSYVAILNDNNDIPEITVTEGLNRNATPVSIQPFNNNEIIQIIAEDSKGGQHNYYVCLYANPARLNNLISMAESMVQADYSCTGEQWQAMQVAKTNAETTIESRMHNYNDYQTAREALETAINAITATYSATITYNNDDYGSALIQNATNLVAGATISVIVDPTAGYKVGTITVSDGVDQIEIIDRGDRYEYVQPENNVTVSITFILDTFSVTFPSQVTVMSNGTPLISGESEVNIGDELTITIVSPSGQEIINVNGTDLTITNGTASYTATEARDVEIQLSLGQKNYTITKAETTNGSFDISPVADNYSDLEIISIILHPDEGYRMSSISVVDSDSNEIEVSDSYTFVMPASNVTVSVTYAQISYHIREEATENGLFTMNKVLAHFGDNIIVYASSDNGYEVSRIYYVVDGTSEEVEILNSAFSMPAGNISVFVEFVQSLYSITFPQYVTVKVNGTAINSGDTFLYGTKGTVTATKPSGYYASTPLAINGTSVHSGFIKEVKGDVVITYVVSEILASNLVVATNPTTTTYDALGTVDLTGAVINVSFNDTSKAAIDVTASVVVTYQNGDSLKYGDTYATLSYTYKEGNTVSVQLPVTVNKIVTTVTTNPTYKTVYVGQTIATIEFNDDGVANPSGGTFSIKESGAGILEDTNTLTLVYTPSDPDNYTTVEITGYVVTANSALVIIFPDKVSVTKGGSPLTSGDTIVINDDIVIEYSTTTGYHVKTFTVSGATQGEGNHYTVTGTVNIIYQEEIDTFTVTVTTPVGGTVTPGTSTVNYDGSITFIITPNDGYEVGEISIEGGEYEGGSDGGELTISNITAPIIVTIPFAQIDYTLTITGTGVTVMRGVDTISNGATIHYGDELTISYTVDVSKTQTLTVDGNAFTNNEAHSVVGNTAVVFSEAIKTYIINATASTGGTIVPTTQTINYGGSQEFVITADAGYEISSFKVDNVETAYVGTKTNATYALTDVTDEHSIEVTFVKTKYTITKAVSHGTMSVVPITATYNESVTISAITPDTGYVLGTLVVAKTSDLSDTIEVNNNVFIMPNEPVTVTATFVLRTFVITIPSYVTVEGSIHGELEDSGTITYGEILTITQSADPTGHTLSALQVNGVDFVSGTTFTVGEEDVIITIANTPNGYDIVYNGMDGATHGEYHPGTHTYGTATQISDPTKMGYTFAGWKVNNGVATTSLVLAAEDYTDSITLEATWNANNYDVTFHTNYGEDAITTQSIAFNSTVALNDAPSRTGYDFVSWNTLASPSQENPGTTYLDKANYTMSSPTGLVLYAQWEKLTYSITVSGDEGGTISPSTNQSVDYNEDITFTITSDAGYEVDTFLVDGLDAELDDSFGGTYTFNDVTTVHTIAVTFKKSDLTITKTTPVNGAFTVPATAQVGDEVTIASITADSGYELDTISVTGTSGTVEVISNKFTMPAETVTVTVTFKAIVYTISFADISNGSATYSGTPTIGQTITVNLSPDSGYELDSISAVVEMEEGDEGEGEGGEEITFDGNTFVMPAGNVVITVSYKASTYILTYDYNEATITGKATETVDFDSMVGTLETPSKDGYSFGGWYLDEDVWNNKVDVTDTWSIADDKTIHAKWDIVNYTISKVEVNGTIAINGTPTIGQTITVDITPDTGYIISSVYYKLNGAGDPVTITVSNSTYSFAMPASNVTVYVDFVLDTYTISLGTITHGDISTTGEPKYGQTIIVNITPDTGYGLSSLTYKLNGTGEPNPISAIGNVYSFTMPASDLTIYAEFSKLQYMLTITGSTEALSVKDSGNNALANGATINHGDIITVEFTKVAGRDRSVVINEISVLDDEYAIGALIQQNYTVSGAVEITFSDSVITYTISVECGDNGSISPTSNTVEYGQDKTYIITPSTGYEINIFLVDGVDAKAQLVGNTYTFEDVVSNSHTLNVTFSKANYSINKVNTTHGSFVTKILTSEVATAQYNDSVIIDITCDEGYEIDTISVTGVTSGDTIDVQDSGSNKVFTMPAEAVNVNVTFVKSDYKVKKIEGVNGDFAIMINGNAWTNGATAQFGDIITITPAPNTGYKVSTVQYQKKGGTATELSSETNEYTFSMPSDEATITVTFSLKTYSLTIEGDTSSIFAIRQGYLLNSDSVLRHFDKLVISYTTKASHIQTFTVNGNAFVSGNELEVSEDVTISLVEVIRTYEITASGGEHGTISPSTTTYNYDDDATFTITPATGYKIDTLTVDGSTAVLTTGSEEAGGTYVFDNVTAIHSISVTFEAIVYSLPSGAPPTNGTYEVTGTPTYESIITVTLDPEPGYQGVITCTKDDDTDAGVVLSGEGNEKTFTMPAYNVTVEVRYEKIDYTINKSSENGSFVVPETAQVDDTVTINTIQPNTGYEMTGITVVDSLSHPIQVIGTSAPYSFTMPDDIVTVTVTFAKTNFAINKSGTNGTFVVPETAQFGDSVTISSIVPAEGYELTSVTVTKGDGNTVEVSNPTEGNYTFTMPAEAVTVQVVFSNIDYDITLESIDNGSAEVEDQAVINQVVQIVITPVAGYELDTLAIHATTDLSDTVQANKVSESAGSITYSFTMPSEDVTIIVVMKCKTYNISYLQTKGASEAGLPTSHTYMTETILVDLGDVTGYAFDGWSFVAGGERVARIPATAYTDTVSIYANWLANTYDLIYEYNEATTEGDASKSITYDHVVGALAVPTKTGYEFGGWYLDNNVWTELVDANTIWTTDDGDRIYAKWIAKSYNVTFHTNYGTDTTTTQSITFGTSENLSDAPNRIGYTFNSWNTLATPSQENPGITYLENADFTMNVEGIDLYAQWTIITNTISVSCGANGTITPNTNQTINYGEDATFVVSANAGYEVDAFLVDGESAELDNNSYTFNNVTAPHTIAVTFKAIVYDIDANAPTHGTYSVVEEAAYASTVTITEITPDMGYELDTISVIGSNGSVSVIDNAFVMPNSAVEITVTFKLSIYNIIKTAPINGAFELSKTTANYQEEITISDIAPAIGYKLDEITITDAQGHPITVTNNTFDMPASNVTVTVTFEEIDYIITKQAPTNGTYSIPATARYGQTVTVTSITPAAGYELDTISVTKSNNATVQVTGNTFVMPSEAVTVTVTFKLSLYNISKTVSQNVTYRVSSVIANMGDNIYITDIALDTGYEITRMYYVITGSDDRTDIVGNTFVMPAGDVKITLVAGKIDYAISKGTIANGTFSVPNTANYGDRVTIANIVANVGYELDTITVVDSEFHNISLDNNAFTMPASTVTITVTFKKVNYTITNPAVSNGSIAISPIKEYYNYGDAIVLTIVPATSYILDTLTISGVTVTGNTNQRTFTMPASNVTIVATFKLDKVVLEDSDVDVEVETTADVLQKDSTMTVEIKQDDTTEHGIVMAALEKDYKAVTVYSIKLYDGNDQPITTLTKAVALKLKIPEGYNKSNIEIYRVDADGTKVKYDHTVSGDYAIINTDHFSIYVVSELKVNIPSEDDNNGGGLGLPVIIGIAGGGVVLIVAIIIIAVVVSKKRKRQI